MTNNLKFGDILKATTSSLLIKEGEELVLLELDQNDCLTPIYVRTQSGHDVWISSMNVEQTGQNVASELSYTQPHKYDTSQGSDIAESIKINELNFSTIQISTFEDAIKLGMATDDEVVLLNEWKNYRILINRVDILMSNIEWPVRPV